MTPSETVERFLARAAQRDYAEALPMLSEDVEYQNMMLPAVFGREAVRETLEGLLALCTASEWIAHRSVAQGSVVMNERTDRFELHGQWVDLPVMGVFEVHEGLITLWRDYFDLQTVMTAMFPSATEPSA